MKIDVQKRITQKGLQMQNPLFYALSLGMLNLSLRFFSPNIKAMKLLIKKSWIAMKTKMISSGLEFTSTIGKKQSNTTPVLITATISSALQLA
jgi:hypothetical protein